jgi:glucose-6-phosphate 1-dehydrogenase
MVQNHLLQILTFVAMEPPVNLEAQSIHSEKIKVLDALRPITAENVHEKTVRGQYTDGFIKGKEVPGYLNEEGANTSSTTESFVALRVDIDNWRWAGVPLSDYSSQALPSLASSATEATGPQVPAG